MVSESEKVDFDCLREFYNENVIAQALLDHFASRERNWGSTSVDRILTNLKNEEKDISRGDLIAVFRKLEECGCGSFVAGRKGYPSRFEWRVQMVAVGQAAAGEIEHVEEVSEEDVGEEDTESLIKHTYRLRPDVTIAVELPTDLTRQEATRVARFIETLPFEAGNE
jgi:hypothetical protein